MGSTSYGESGHFFDSFGQGGYRARMEFGSNKRLPGSLRILCEAAPDFGVEVDRCLEGTGIVEFDIYRNGFCLTRNLC